MDKLSKQETHTQKSWASSNPTIINWCKLLFFFYFYLSFNTVESLHFNVLKNNLINNNDFSYFHCNTYMKKKWKLYNAIVQNAKREDTK